MVPVGGVLPVAFPASFAVRDALAALVQIVNLSAFRAPSPIQLQWPHGQHDMGVGVACALIVNGKIGAHPGRHKIVFDV